MKSKISQENLFVLLSRYYGKNVFLVPKLKEDGVELQILNKGGYRECEVCLAGKDETDRLFWYKNCSRCVNATIEERNMIVENIKKHKKTINCFLETKEYARNFISVDDFIEELSKLPKGSFITIEGNDDSCYFPEITKINELDYLFKVCC